MQLVSFHDGAKTIDISLAKDAGYAFPLPFMPVAVDMLTLTTPVDEAVMAIKNTRMELEHLALSVEAGEADLYYRGHKILSASTGAFTVTGFELGEGLHSEHILSPKTARPEDISTWSNMRSPFFDPSPVIPDSQIPSASSWNQAVADASQALADAAEAKGIADGKVTTYYQSTEPEAEALGDLWVHTGEGNKLYRWDETEWVAIQDAEIQEAVQKAKDAQATADGKIVTFYQPTPPTATAVGDLWVDTDDNNHLYRWDGTEWVDIQDKSPIPDERIPSAEEWNRKARTFYQDTPPVASGMGDIWIDTSDFNHRYWWDGTTWADMSDTSPVDASQRPIHAQGLGGDIYFDQHGYRAVRKADGKTMMHFDLETGSNYWEGDGIFRGRVEAEEGYFRGDITGASGTFSGTLAAESIEYTNLKVAFAKVTSAESWWNPPDQAIVTPATHKDGWNLLYWPGTLGWAGQAAEVWVYHQPLTTLSGTVLLQISRNGTLWSDEIDLAYSNLVTGVYGHSPYHFSVDGAPFAIAPRLVTPAMVNFYIFRDNSGEEYLGSTLYIRFKRHAIA